ncbi:hypothetical protein B0H16DRAFT_727320 [Mycena metata]|uniref:Uncharacterized protein n=1 Tax=Mycena metata TaxID=1033252 RepID=A0AAD7NY06_9AGAR|nr:hypothetical protein B0H16DRAFT_727320 [Mycena metata]
MAPKSASTARKGTKRSASAPAPDAPASPSSLAAPASLSAILEVDTTAALATAIAQNPVPDISMGDFNLVETRDATVSNICFVQQLIGIDNADASADSHTNNAGANGVQDNGKEDDADDATRPRPLRQTHDERVEEGWGAGLASYSLLLWV